MEANLLVTFEPSHEETAKKEIEALLKEADKKAKILKIEGSVVFASVGDPIKTISLLKKTAKKNKEKYSNTFNWWPVCKWCKAEIKDMQKAISEMQKEIDDKEKWKMDLGKRQAKKEYPKDLIIKLTDVVNKKNVDLDKPEKIIKVEIIGSKAAISVIPADSILSAAQL